MKLNWLKINNINTS